MEVPYTVVMWLEPICQLRPGSNLVSNSAESTYPTSVRGPLLESSPARSPARLSRGLLANRQPECLLAPGTSSYEEREIRPALPYTRTVQTVKVIVKISTKILNLISIPYMGCDAILPLGGKYSILPSTLPAQFRRVHNENCNLNPGCQMQDLG